ncbi:conserved hypothetical protein [Ricinus communis]|uniref:Uncharacterized protein n=2 Tax=Ricinus communis TaxID=3988 RepID=B9R6U2_RICCO|nr:conserved hypothetical protein [Ricinus communis]
MKKGNANPIMFSSADNFNSQNPYWPELPLLAHPVPYSYQEPRFNDHASIRKLLTKLGGRFSDDDDLMIHNSSNPQFPNEISYTPQLYDQTTNISSSASMEALSNNASAQFAQTQYNSIDWSGLQMLQGQSSFHGGSEEIAYNNNTKRLDGLEFLLGDDILNDRLNGSLGEMSSLVYPPVASNCEGILQQKLL